MSWAGASPVIGGALWSGNAPLVTTRQLISTVSSATVTLPALWSLYPAISTVNMSTNSLINVSTIITSNLIATNAITTPFISTIELFCSSINNSTIVLFGSTVTIENVTITNGTVKADTVEKTKDVFDYANEALGVAGNAVSVVQGAVSGFLADAGSAMQQVLWTTYAIDKVVNLATDVVKLATGIQGFIDSREQNNISGGNVPGQSARVYETFNGTTQLQFSTLGAPTWTVFRTTDQLNPNMTLGKEIYISTLIPAGSKSVRSIGDPMNLPILSTQLLSTTNYAQSFGQWQAILGTDYNLLTSTLTADNVSSLFAEINTISSGKLTTSSITVLGGLVFSTLASPSFDISRQTISTVTSYDSVSSVTQPFLNYQMTLTTTSQSESFDMGSWFDVTPTNASLWSHKQLDYSGAYTTGSYPTVNIVSGTFVTGDFFDLKNIATGSVVLVWNPFESGGLLLQVVPGTFYRFTYSGTAWSYAANPTQTTQTNTNSFNIVQAWDNTTISTNNLLTINAGEVTFPGYTNTNIGTFNNLTATNAYVSTLKVQTGIFSTLNVSTIYTQNIIDVYVSTTTAFFDQVYTSSIYASNAIISTGTISTLTAGYLTFQNVNAYSISTTNLSSQNIRAMTGYISSLNSEAAAISSISTATITGFPGGGGSSTTISFSFTGANQTWTAPAGVTYIDIILKGASGGNYSGAGGSGGSVSGRLTVVPGQTYTIIVGQGGGSTSPGTGTYGGGGGGNTSGGGRSAISYGGVDLATAGGGGGTAYFGGPNGGAGGGLTGQSGSGISADGGLGGTQTAGGSGGVDSNPGGNGAQYAGGGGSSYGGGGGSGWFGGGGGADNATPPSFMGGGGGGGSSYVGNLYFNVTNVQGGGATAGNNGTASLVYYSGTFNVLTVNAEQTNILGNAFIDGDVTGVNSLTALALNANTLTLAQPGGLPGGKIQTISSLTLSSPTVAISCTPSTTAGFTINGKGMINFEFGVSQSYSFNQLSGTKTVTDASGNKYHPSKWVMNHALLGIYEFAGINTAPAFNFINTYQTTDVSGNFALNWQIFTNVDRSGNNAVIKWNLTMIPLEMTQAFSTVQVTGDAVVPIALSTVLYTYPNTYISTLLASTINIKAIENISLNAGLGFPTFLGNGTVAINASTNVNLMANFDINLGASHAVAITGNSTITMTALSSINTVPATYFSGDVRLSSINGSNYPPTNGGTVTSTFTTLYTSTLAGNPNYLSLTATRSITLNTLSTINTVPATYFSGDVRLSSINGSNYPPTNGGTVTSTFTTLYTSTLAGNPNYLSLTATRSITLSTLSTINTVPATYFSGDVRMSSLNGAAIGGGGGGGWVSTATSALNMGTYAINGSALTINSSNSGDFNIKTQTGSGAALNLTADNYMFFHTNVNDMYFDPHTDIGGNAPGNWNFGGNNFYANSYNSMNLTNYGTGGAGLTLTSYDRLLMYSDTQLSMTCSNLTIDLTGYGGVSITDSSTGGTGLLTVSATNHLYWNGRLIT